jgi:putative ABC transport system ATP-binding protein
MDDTNSLQIELRGVSKGYSGQPVLEAADLRVRRGQAIVIRGRSGSGKSTLLKLIGGLDTPDSGAILHSGRDLAQMNDQERTLFRRRSLGFVFQFFNLIPTLTVAENIRLPLALNRFADEDASDRVVTLLHELELDGRAQRYPEELSGGEQQRVAIARALAHRPDLIIADEPTGNLDLETATLVIALLERVCRESSTTLVVATHSGEVASIADCMLQIRDRQLEVIS